MTDYTPAEIEEAVTAGYRYSEEDVDEEDLEEGWPGIGWGEPVVLTLRGEKVTAEPVERHGGGAGDGEDTWAVFRLGTQLFKKSGYHASHYGTDWDGDLTEVSEVRKIVTFYE